MDILKTRKIMSVLIRTISITILLFIIITLSSCSNTTSDNIKEKKAINNKNDLYEIVDSIYSSTDKFSTKNIYIMGNLYKNTILQDAIISDAYVEVDDYFLDLFFENDSMFYNYLFELNDNDILHNINRVINQHFDLVKDYTHNFNFYKDSIYCNHLKNNIDKKAFIDSVFSRTSPLQPKE